MELIIGGGCGEHGRNCFYFTDGSHSIIVDCGKMAGTSACYPHLSAQQISSADYLFITHSHNDHSGALLWLVQNGFHGKVVMAAATLMQLPPGFVPKESILIDVRVKPRQALKLTPWLSVSWGRTGHCAGSCWYLLAFASKQILCSGDYIENAAAYAVDELRGISADLAIIDAAYTGNGQNADDMRQRFVQRLQELQKQRPLLLLPVPKYGRGFDVLLTLRQVLPKLPLYVDDCLTMQLSQVHSYTRWLTADALHALQELHWQRLDYMHLPDAGVCLFCDPQIKQTANSSLVVNLAGKAFSIASGHLDQRSNADSLAADGLLLNIPYPVHGTDEQLVTLIKENSFSKVIVNHSAALVNPQTVKF